MYSDFLELLIKYHRIILVLLLTIGCALIFEIIYFIRTSNCVVFASFVKKRTHILEKCSVEAKIVLFYVVFYAALAGFFAAILAVFFSTSDSTLKLEFRPLPLKPYEKSTLVWFEASNERSVKPWITALDDFLEIYKKDDPVNDRNRVYCDFYNPPRDGKVCDINSNAFGICTKENHYGYTKASPCVFLKLNNVYGWNPQFYNISSDFPSNMPDYLQEKIKGISVEDKKHEMIWVSCEGENPADIENLGPINYFPSRGFPGYYFPFMNQKGYLPPVLAINFERPRTGVLINIVCKIWVRNIAHDMGSVHFELMID